MQNLRSLVNIGCVLWVHQTEQSAKFSADDSLSLSAFKRKLKVFSDISDEYTVRHCCGVLRDFGVVYKYLDSLTMKTVRKKQTCVTGAVVCVQAAPRIA